MSRNAWKSASVFLLTGLAVWYASFHDVWGVLIGLAVSWRFLLGDLKIQYGPQSSLADAQFSDSYVGVGGDAFERDSGAAVRFSTAQDCLHDLAVAEIQESSFEPSGSFADWIGNGRDRVIPGDRLVVASDVMAMLEHLVEVETALAFGLQSNLQA